MLGYSYGKMFGSKIAWAKWLRLFSSQTFSRMNTPTFLKHSHSTPTCLWKLNRQSVPKRRHIKFRCQGITRKKTYNVQNTAKVWNQGSEGCLLCHSFRKRGKRTSLLFRLTIPASPLWSEYCRRGGKGGTCSILSAYSFRAAYSWLAFRFSPLVLLATEFNSHSAEHSSNLKLLTCPSWRHGKKGTNWKQRPICVRGSCN